MLKRSMLLWLVVGWVLMVGVGCESGGKVVARGEVGDVKESDADGFGGYYAGIDEGLRGAALKKALHELIDEHRALPYTSDEPDVWDALSEIDADEGRLGFVVTLYSGESLPASDRGTRGHQWNREHVWAKSRGDFGTRVGAGTDLHHLRVVDSSMNSTRNNRHFAEGGRVVMDNDGDGVVRETKAKLGVGVWTFEPPDEVKGDVARMLFYMVVRYEGDAGEPDLELTEVVLGKGGKEGLHGVKRVLLKWHTEDGVSARERRRNELVMKWQGNRNPFIDHPAWVGRIWE